MKVTTKLIIRYTLLQIVFVFITLPFMILPTKYLIKLLYPTFAWLFRYAAKIKVFNLSKESIDKNEPVIYACNHKCFADFVLVASFLKHPFTIMVKEEMTKIPVFNLIAKKMKLIPVLRGNNISQLKAIQKAKKTIQKDKFSIIMFPEGIYILDKPVGPIKTGVSKIAKETGAKVIPVAIYGVTNSFVNEKKLVWKNAYIKCGKPINYFDFNNKDNFAKEIENKISKLYNEIKSDLKNS